MSFCYASAHFLYLGVFHVFYVQIKPSKYRCAVDIKAPNYRAGDGTRILCIGLQCH